MNADEYWAELNEKKRVTGDVVMTPEQFEKMLRQAHEVGRKEGYKSALGDISDPNTEAGKMFRSYTSLRDKVAGMLDGHKKKRAAANMEGFFDELMQGLQK